MQNKISLKNPVFRFIADAAEALHYETYAVGGYVRDQLLERDCKDIDFVCVGNGIELAERAAHKIDPRLNVTVFKNFGTAHFRWHDLDLEFVGARKESYQRDSRKREWKKELCRTTRTAATLPLTPWPSA